MKKNNSTGKYWTSREEFYRKSEGAKVRNRDGIVSPAKRAEDGIFDRRDFLKISGIAAVFAAAGCGQRPVENIIPYLNQPEEITPGVSNYYASTCRECSAGCGIIVKTREGRPIKIEGNPEHPLNKGKLCARGQASLLDLYDPDRLRQPMKIRNKTGLIQIDWAEADKIIAHRLKSAPDKSVLLTGTSHGPAQDKLIEEFLKTFAGARHIMFDALTDDALIEAQKSCYGKGIVPDYRFDRADVIVIFGADPIANSHSVVQFSRDFTTGRKIHNRTMSKVICFEPTMSLTGSNADIRYPVRSADLIKVALSIAHQIVITDTHSSFISNDAIRNILKEYPPLIIEEKLKLAQGTIEGIARSLWEARGRSLVFAGGAGTRNEWGTALHCAVNLLNSILGNDGVTVTASSESNQLRGSLSEMLKLIEEMKADKIRNLLIYQTNPVYVLPPESGFIDALSNVSLKVSLSDRIDETAAWCDYILPSLHYLESWEDAEPIKGLYSIIQPAIAPLWNNRSFQDTLIALMIAAEKDNRFVSGASSADKNKPVRIAWYDYIKSTWKERISSVHDNDDFETFWISTLQKGVYDSRGSADSIHPGRTFILNAFNSFELPTAAQDLELVMYAPALLYDGRQGNNPWLLEAPDPITKLCWENTASIAPETAQNLGLEGGDIVHLNTSSGARVEIPIHIQPGIHRQVVAVPIGSGRTHAGRFGNGNGINAFLLSYFKNTSHLSGIPITLEKTGQRAFLTDVQGNNSIDHRPILFETTLEEYHADPKAGIHYHDPEPVLPSIWGEKHPYPEHKWGMAIDLNSCIGCGACMIACQAENNIPIVGKDQIHKAREMWWIRIDRYYRGNPDNPEVSHQPMLCQHCDNAPCETVCPVIATVHNDEGLNVQIYNRCVGTRYCSHNCPYKVRRFNFFEYSGYTKDAPLYLVLNPDVVVREKGVMEKCTLCIQRIREEHYKAKAKGIQILDGAVKTACEQTCPGDAIIFGDMNDPASRLSKRMNDPRGFQVLRDLNTNPSITYLTKIRNRTKSREELNES